MLHHPDLAGVNYFAVAGAYGGQNSSIYIDEPILFNMSFGAENACWTDAHSDRTGSVTRVKNLVLPVLNSGGRVWVQEAGQSDFTAAWVRLLVADGVNSTVLKSKVVVVQHSTWSEDMTTPADLTYVKNTCDYWAIDDGNTAKPTGDKNRGIKTPGYGSRNTT